MITNAELGTEAKRFTIEQGFEPDARIPAQKAYIAGFTYCRELLHKHDVSGSAICKQPIGLMPKYIHIENRLSDITEAILRYYNDRREIPMEWVQEYNELMKGIAI